MTASELSNAIQPVLDNWYNNLKKHLHTGSLSSSNTIYCQDVINLYETEEYWAIELTGQQKLQDFSGITFSKKVKKLNTINNLINGGTAISDQATYNPRINIETAGEVWAGLQVASYDAYNSSTQSLNIENWKKGLAAAPSIPIQVHANAGGLMLADATIMRLEAPKLYLRSIPMILVVSKKSDPIRLVHFLIARLNETFPKRDRFIGIYDDEYTQKNPVVQFINDNNASLETFLEENAALLAQVLGYKAAKANVPVEGHAPIDLLLEKEDGSHDLFNLQTGLFSRQATTGKKNKPNLSTYAIAIKEQLQTLQEQIGLQLAANPLMIGIVENTNQVYHQALNKAATEHSGNIALLSLDSLSSLVELSIKNKL